jgi:hypothetical protein
MLIIFLLPLLPELLLVGAGPEVLSTVFALEGFENPLFPHLIEVSVIAYAASCI